MNAKAAATKRKGRAGSSIAIDANISPPARSDSTPDKPCRCVRKNGDSQAAFAQMSGGTSKASHAIEPCLRGSRLRGECPLLGVSGMSGFGWEAVRLLSDAIYR